MGTVGQSLSFESMIDVLALAYRIPEYTGQLGKRYRNIHDVRIALNQFKRRIFIVELKDKVILSIPVASTIRMCSRPPKKKHRKVHPIASYEHERHRFVKACRLLTLKDAPKLYQMEAHHGNPGGFSAIVSSFIVLYDIKLGKKRYTIPLGKKSFCLIDGALVREFREYHASRVKWVMMSPGDHKKLHGL